MKQINACGCHPNWLGNDQIESDWPTYRVSWWIEKHLFDQEITSWIMNRMVIAHSVFARYHQVKQYIVLSMPHTITSIIVANVGKNVSSTYDIYQHTPWSAIYMAYRSEITKAEMTLMFYNWN